MCANIVNLSCCLTFCLFPPGGTALIMVYIFSPEFVESVEKEPNTLAHHHISANAPLMAVKSIWIPLVNNTHILKLTVLVRHLILKKKKT